MRWGSCREWCFFVSFCVWIGCFEFSFLLCSSYSPIPCPAFVLFAFDSCLSYPPSLPPYPPALLYLRSFILTLPPIRSFTSPLSPPTQLITNTPLLESTCSTSAANAPNARNGSTASRASRVSSSARRCQSMIRFCWKSGIRLVPISPSPFLHVS